MHSKADYAKEGIGCGGSAPKPKLHSAAEYAAEKIGDLVAAKEGKSND